MKRIFLLAIIILQSFIFFSQTHLPSYFFRSQEGIDSFSIKYPNCTSVDYVQIEDSSNTIVDVSSLNQIKKVKTVWILRNPKLKKIDLFNEIETDTVYSFLIDYNPLLDTLRLFNKSKICTEGFEIRNEKPLYIDLFKEIDSSYFFQIRLPSEGISVLRGFEKARAFQSASFIGSIDLPQFKNLRNVSSNLGILNTNILSNMNKFSSLESVRSLSIGNVRTQLSLQGLENLKSIQSLSLIDIEVFDNFIPLKDVYNLNSLTIDNVKSNVQISQFRNYNSIGRISLTKIDGEIDFSNVEFDSLKYLVLIENSKNIDLNFEIKYIPNVFNKFNQVVPGSALYRYKEYNGNSLILANNPTLDYCNSKAICGLVNAIPENEIAIENNGPNCSTVEEVKAACIVNTSEFESDNIYVYPNPFYNDFNIQCDNCKDDYKINIYDILGRKVNTKYSKSDNNYYINTSEWDKGYYFLKLSDINNDGEIVKPLIKF